MTHDIIVVATPYVLSFFVFAHLCLALTHPVESKRVINLGIALVAIACAAAGFGFI